MSAIDLFQPPEGALRMFARSQGPNAPVMATQLPGCIAYEHRLYGDGNSYRYSRPPEGIIIYSRTQAKDLWVMVLANGDVLLAYVCGLHSGVIKRSDRYSAIKVASGPVETAAAYTNIHDIIEGAKAENSRRKREAAEARQAYLNEGRVPSLLRAQTELTRDPGHEQRVEVVTDEFGASRVRVGSNWNRMSIPDARRMVRALTEAIETASAANEAVLDAAKEV